MFALKLLAALRGIMCSVCGNNPPSMGTMCDACWRAAQGRQPFV